MKVDILEIMLRIFLMAILILFAFLFAVGIKALAEQTEIKVETKEDDRFEIIQEWTNNFVFYDKETKVQYYYIYDGVTVLLDEDGKPLLYEGDQI